MKIILSIVALLCITSIGFAEDFKVEKIADVSTSVIGHEVTPTQSYKLTIYKDAIDDKGLAVKVEDSVCYVTEESLTQDIARKQAELDALQAKLNEVIKTNGE